MPTPQVVRIVVRGWTYGQRDSDNFAEARAMLSRAFASKAWPSGLATFAVTPGGFIRSKLPRDYDGSRGWDSKKCDLDKLIPYAEVAVAAVVQGDVLKNARRRTRFLTLGVDLNRKTPQGGSAARRPSQLPVLLPPSVYACGTGGRPRYEIRRGRSLDRQVQSDGRPAAHSGPREGPPHAFLRNRLRASSRVGLPRSSPLQRSGQALGKRTHAQGEA